LLASAAALGLLAAPYLRSPNPILVWNASPSVPTGLCHIARATPVVMELVLAQLPRRYAALAARRNYLPRAAYLLKPVAATAGITVCRRGAHVFVGAKLVARARLRDAAARPLPFWQGCKVLQPGEIFLLANDPDSFDYAGDCGR
jgi:type IV secretory pathway protease TraF